MSVDIFIYLPLSLSDLDIPFLMLPLLQGDYEGQATFYGKSRPDLVLGCVNMKFSVA